MFIVLSSLRNSFKDQSSVHEIWDARAANYLIAVISFQGRATPGFSKGHPRGRTSVSGTGLVTNVCRVDFGLAPSQWEMSLQSNVVSHWADANLESALVCDMCAHQQRLPEPWCGGVLGVAEGSPAGMLRGWPVVSVVDTDAQFCRDADVSASIPT